MWIKRGRPDLFRAAGDDAPFTIGNYSFQQIATILNLESTDSELVSGIGSLRLPATRNGSEATCRDRGARRAEAESRGWTGAIVSAGAKIPIVPVENSPTRDKD